MGAGEIFDPCEENISDEYVSSTTKPLITTTSINDAINDAWTTGDRTT
ncbi:5186_t:CDS:2, partial [Funneliformis caledonium]